MDSDDKRYVASLQDTVDLACHKDFFESNNLEETKQKADESAERYQRNVLIFDRKQLQIVHKIVKNVKKEDVEKPIVRRVKSVVKKPVEIEQPKKKISKDDFFE